MAADTQAWDPLPLWVPVAIAALAIGVAAVTMQAWGPAMNDPDSMSSVLYFQRILGGQRLEVTVLTTPKPLLSVLYGTTWFVAHDWRAIVWETLAVHGLAVFVGIRLAARLAGVAAAAFVAAALIASGPELLEISQANSLPWALAGWLVAGLAVTATPRRFGIAGVALMLAGMARIETWLVMGGATVAIGALAVPAIRARLGPGTPSARSALPLMIGWIALPVQLLHDLLLTGNPLYWLSVPTAYTALVTPNLRGVPPSVYVPEVLDRYAGMPLLTALALVGLGYLVLSRRWAIFVGLAALVGGGLALLVSLAWRGIYISPRYFEEADLGMLFAAGIGVGGLARFAAWGTARLAGRWWSDGPMAAWKLAAASLGAVAAGVVLALIVQRPGPLDRQISARFATLRAASGDLERAMPAIRRAMTGRDGPDPVALVVARGFTDVDPRHADLFVPRPLQRRIAIELDVSLTRLADSRVAFLRSPPARLLQPGQLVYHDRYADLPASLFRVFEVTRATELGKVRLVPVQVEAGASWLLRVEG
jgi:hypothetical protein